MYFTKEINNATLSSSKEKRNGGFEYDSIVNLGDIITAETEYLGNVTGRIKSQRYSLNGGIIVKECEMA